MCSKDFIKIIREFKSSQFYKENNGNRNITDCPKFKELIYDYVGDTDKACKVCELIDVILNNTDINGMLKLGDKKTKEYRFVENNRLRKRKLLTKFGNMIGRLYQFGGNGYQNGNAKDIENLLTLSSAILSGKSEEVENDDKYFIKSLLGNANESLKEDIINGAVVRIGPSDKLNNNTAHIFNVAYFDNKFVVIGTGDTRKFDTLEEAFMSTTGYNVGTYGFTIALPITNKLEQNNGNGDHYVTESNKTYETKSNVINHSFNNSNNSVRSNNGKSQYDTQSKQKHKEDGCTCLVF